MVSPVEAALLKVGTSVATTILKRWAGELANSRYGPLSPEAILETDLPSLTQRRKAQRTFSQLADDVADRLGRHFKTEFEALEQGETVAAADAVAETVESGTTSYELLFEKDLDPLRLERELRRRNPDAAARWGLGEAGSALYGLVLREACNYIVEITMTLPPFGSHAAREMLKRQSELMALVEQVLERLPTDQGWTHSAFPEDQFEQQYRRDVARKLDRLQLFGVKVGEANRRYALSVAYISLAVSRAHARQDSSYLRVEEALSRGSRHLIRGEAGSGKTTLLQWLAVKSARREFPSVLREWNTSVPFFLQLRRFTDRDLPTPEEFPAQVNATLAGEAPARWVRSRLRDDAIVLIDGLDELPAERRASVREWLEDLCSTYPSARYVVTTRPTAVREQWLAADNFIESELQPMTLGDVRSFLNHWHAAAKAEPEADKADIDALESRLAASLASTPHLKALATNPLLCAMLCALHRDRRSRLPRYRTELYRIALETLLERRDLDREIPTALTDLDATEKEFVLQDLAWWMLANNQTLVETSIASDLVAKRLGSLPHVQIGAVDLLEELVLRTGVLREPAPGQIDFIHKTFQEYFAAAEIVDQHMFGMLLRHAAEDQWREVVILASGLARGRSREDLLGGMLEQRDAGQSDQAALQLLAVECLEAAPHLSEELTERIRSTVSGHVPPRDMAEARALAAAGDAVVPLLVGLRHETESTVAACVRCLAYVGSDAALDALTEYGDDARPEVVGALLDSWARFDPVLFARRVLRDSPLMNGRLVLHDAALIAPCAELANLRSIDCDITGTIPAPDALQATDKFERVSVEDSRGIEDLSGLGAQPQLRRLALGAAPDLIHLGPLEPLPALETVVLSEASALRRIASLRDSALTELTIHGARELADIQGLEGAQALKTLRITESLVIDLRPLEGAASLELLDLSGSSRLTWVQLSHPTLREVVLARCPAVQDVTWLGALSELRRLVITEAKAMADLDPLAGLTKLEHLDVSRCRGVRDVTALEGATELRRLKLAVTNVADVDPLRGLDKLEELDLSETNVRTIRQITGLGALRALVLRRCQLLSAIGGLAAMTSLEILDLTGLPLRAFEALDALPPVKRLSISQDALGPMLAHIRALPGLERLEVDGGFGNFDLRDLEAADVAVVSVT